MLTGIYCFLKGFLLITKPDIRVWVIIPFLINLLLFSILGFYSWLYFPLMLDTVIAYLQLPKLAWIFAIVRWIMLPLFIIFSIVIFFFLFTFIGNLIGEPFNGALSRAVEKHITGRKIKVSVEPIWKLVISFIGEKLEKLWYYLKWVILLLIVSLIPIINIISPILWFLFFAWIAAQEYADPVLANHGYSVPMQRKLLAKKPLLTLGFGSSILITMFIPIINFFVMPAAVAGATYMWLHKL